MENREIKLLTPWKEGGVAFRVIQTDNGKFELQRLSSSHILCNANIWRYVNDFNSLQEVNEYLDELFNEVFPITMTAENVFLVIDACKHYSEKCTHEDEKKELNRVVQLIINNITNLSNKECYCDY